MLGFILSRTSALLRRPCTEPPRPLDQRSSLEVDRPSSVFKYSESAYCPGSTRNASLLGLSQTLEGFLLAEPRGPVSYRIRSWGSHSSRLFPSADPSELVARRYPLGVLRPFRSQPANRLRPLRPSHPQGFASYESPLPPAGYCTRCRPDALMSFHSISVVFCSLAWSFPFRAPTCLAARSSSSSFGSSAHDLSGGDLPGIASNAGLQRLPLQLARLPALAKRLPL